MRCSLGLAMVGMAALYAASAAAQPEAFELPFWPGRSKQQDPRLLRILDHPCGRVAIARVAILPGSEEQGAPISEQVLEIGASGTLVRRWRMPVDSYPLAFHGDYLIFRSGMATYRVDQQGSVSRDVGPRPVPASPMKNCAEGLDFPQNSYMVCQILTDRSTGKPRRIRFEAPCT